MPLLTQQSRSRVFHDKRVLHIVEQMFVGTACTQWQFSPDHSKE